MSVRLQYGMHEGTSQSAGFVAGAAALLLAAHKAAGHNASGADMRDPLMRGVLPSAALTSKCGAGACTRWDDGTCLGASRYLRTYACKTSQAAQLTGRYGVHATWFVHVLHMHEATWPVCPGCEL